MNVAGVYAMTELLMPALKRASPDSRVITVASGGMLTENLTENLQVLFPSVNLNALMFLGNSVGSISHILDLAKILDSLLVCAVRGQEEV